MFLIFILLLIGVSAEWIEITQQYRKPTNKHSSESDQVYFNDSIEHWHQSQDFFSVRDRVNSNVYHKVNFDINSDNKKKVPTESMGKIERVSISKVGNVKRVQISDSTVKSSAIKTENSRLVTTARDKLSDTAKQNNLRNNLQDNRKEHQATEPIATPVNTNKNLNSSLVLDNPLKSYKPLRTYKEKPTFVRKGDSFEAEVTKEEEKQPNKNTLDFRNKPITTDIPKIVSKDEKLTQKNEILTINYVKAIQKKNNKISNKQDASNNKNEPHKSIVEDPKDSTLETVIKFMKIITDTISKNTRKKISTKVRYLEDLRNTILTNIKHRIDVTWPDDSDRQKRSADDARGHVQFPSSESALMTISFLTFAVFLIKLVLQVIQTYKSKTMMVAPVVVTAAGRASQDYWRSNQD